jgi:hypothetical protein
MIVRTQMIVKCLGCDETKPIQVTIIDDVAGPALCDACITRRRTQQRHAAETSLAERLAPSPSSRA